MLRMTFTPVLIKCLFRYSSSKNEIELNRGPEKLLSKSEIRTRKIGKRGDLIFIWY